MILISSTTCGAMREAAAFERDGALTFTLTLHSHARDVRRIPGTGRTQTRIRQDAQPPLQYRSEPNSQRGEERDEKVEPETSSRCLPGIHAPATRIHT